VPGYRSMSQATAIRSSKFPGMDLHIADMPKFVQQPRGPIMLPGCGHITQEECETEVNAAMIDFIRFCVERGRL
jgi:hypothetical protein